MSRELRNRRNRRTIWTVRRAADESVDLIYLDPPFQSGRNYNRIFQPAAGQVKGATAQAKAFEDTWTWGPEAEASYTGLIAGKLNKEAPNQKLIDLMKSMRGYLGEFSTMAYLAMLGRTRRSIQLRTSWHLTSSFITSSSMPSSQAMSLRPGSWCRASSRST